MRRITSIDKTELKCRICHITKPISEYHKDKRNRLGIVSLCKPCANQKTKENQTPAYRRQYRLKQKQRLLDYKKALWCQHCGEADWRCLDFHHLDRSQKKFSIGAQECRSFKSILNEIAKCVVLCANCHRKEHERIDN